MAREKFGISGNRAGIAVGLGQTDAILSRFLIDISGTKI
jgi:hypothetical protein